jgi:hypothetical protein
LREFQSLVNQNPSQSVSIPYNPYVLKITEQALVFTISDRIFLDFGGVRKIYVFEIDIFSINYIIFCFKKLNLFDF